MKDWPEIRDAVARLCERFPGEYWRALDRERTYPTEFVQALTDAGYLSILVPEEYGGSGLPVSAAAAVLEEIHRAGCNGAACHAQMYTMGTVLRHGNDAQKQRWLPGIASGELRLQAFGVTEPSSGSNTLALRTTAVKKGNSHYVVNGQKVWTSRAEHSDLMLLLARTTPAAEVKKRTEGLSVFLVDMREAKGNGLDIRPIRTMINHSTTEIFFDDLEIPADSLIGAEANMAKLLASEASWKAADMCMQTHGGFAFAEEYDVERKFRETRLYRIAPISNNLVLSYLAEHVLGLPRSY